MPRSYRILKDDHWQTAGNLYVRDMDTTPNNAVFCYDMSFALIRFSFLISRAAALFYYWLTVTRSEHRIMHEFQTSLR